MQYFIDEAEMYGISLEENVMDYYAYKGDVVGASFFGATPGTDYVIYAYGQTQAENWKTVRPPEADQQCSKDVEADRKRRCLLLHLQKYAKYF